MPPRLRISRPSSGEVSTAWWKNGVSGAPSPPAAMSRARKSATTVTPVRSAITEGSPIWSVARRSG